MSPNSNQDLYAVLGVARDADADAIKKAYRRLAGELHPDRNPGDDRAEERFKDVGLAYAVLSDAEKRRDYDEFGEIALEPSFDAAKARAFGNGPFGVGGFPGGVRFESTGEGGFAGGLGGLFEELFGQGARASMQMRGADLETTIELDFVEAALGCERSVAFIRPAADGAPGERESLKIRIPPGVEDGGRIRLAGKGAPGLGGGPPGDLHARVRVHPHRFFRREGRDLHLEVPVGVTEAVLGTEIEIPTLDGHVTLRVPAGTDGGSKLRLRGKGIKGAGGRAPGNLYVTIRIRVPRSLDPDARRRYEELAEHDPKDLRAELR